jgi:hypothetical protein
MSLNLKSSTDGTKAILGINGGEQLKVSSAGDLEIQGKVKSQTPGAPVVSDSPMVIDVNSSQPALRVTQTGTGEAIRVEDSANPDSTPFTVDSAGNIRTSGTLACLISGSDIGQELINGNFSGMILNYDSNIKGPQLQLKGVSGCYIDLSPTPEPGVAGQPNDFVLRLWNTKSAGHVVANADSNLFLNGIRGEMVFGNSGTKPVDSPLYSLSSVNQRILPNHSIDTIAYQPSTTRHFTFGGVNVTRHFMADGTINAPVACSNGAYIASLRGFAYSGDGKFLTYGMGGNGSVDIRTVGAQTSANCGGELSFATHPANTGPSGCVERMVIKSDGDVTIGGNSVITTDTYKGGFKNLVINGNFDIWQRRTTTTDNLGQGHRCADRWQVGNNIFQQPGVTGNSTYSRRMCEGNELSNFQAKYYHRTQNNNVSLNGLNLNTQTNINYGVLAIQTIENAAQVLGKTVTLSFWARASVPTKIVSESQIYDGFATPTICKTFDLTTQWQKFVHTYKMPTYEQVLNAGYSSTVDTTSTTPVISYIGAANMPPLSSWLFQVDLKPYWSLGGWRQTGNASVRPPGFEGTEQSLADMQAMNNSLITNGYYDIAQIQLELGDKATAFEHRPIGIELALCQRYYFNSYYGSGFPVGTNLLSAYNQGAWPIQQQQNDGGYSVDGWRTSSTIRSTRGINAFFEWPVTMRAKPVVTVYSYDGLPGYLSLWLQTWTPTLSDAVHVGFASGIGVNGYSIVSNQPEGTGPGKFETITNGITNYTITTVVSGFDQNGTPLAWYPYSVAGANEAWNGNFVANTTAKEKIMLLSSPHYCWHIEAIAEL